MRAGKCARGVCRGVETEVFFSGKIIYSLVTHNVRQNLVHRQHAQS